ncbi:MAG TPA: hypothetical protein P5561_00770 [Candidatus Omnitrophota bacterium]|nr:hypothetical protein [Candidatus Omnitrophota bacterium]HRY85045.1 hypothetical protein [Candidatus Omnitrophota bacterium]
MYFLIIAFGFLLAVRGAKPAPLQDPKEGLRRVWREAVDFFLTTALLVALWIVWTSVGKAQALAREYAFLGIGAASYLLARYQKKTDLFFLCVAVTVFAVLLRQEGFLTSLSWVWAISLGIAFFQVCFLGLRYQLLLSRVPSSMKGWPLLCLLAGFISMALWGITRLVF